MESAIIITECVVNAFRFMQTVMLITELRVLNHVQFYVFMHCVSNYI